MFSAAQLVGDDVIRSDAMTTEIVRVLDLTRWNAYCRPIVEPITNLINRLAWMDGSSGAPYWIFYAEKTNPVGHEQLRRRNLLAEIVGADPRDVVVGYHGIHLLADVRLYSFHGHRPGFNGRHLTFAERAACEAAGITFRERKKRKARSRGARRLKEVA